MSNTQTDISIINFEVSNFKTKMNDNSIQSYNDLCDQINKSNETKEADSDYLLDEMISLKLQQNKIQSKQNNMDERLIDLQWREMRENLIVSGIDEMELPNVYMKMYTNL